MSNSISRREFVASSAAMAAAPAFLNAQTAGDRVAIGWVGLGNRGGKSHLHDDGAGRQRRLHQGHLRGLRAASGQRQGRHRHQAGPGARHLQRLLPHARGQIDRRHRHHDARAPASRYGDRRARGRQARLLRKAPDAHHRGRLPDSRSGQEKRQEISGRHAAAQLAALQKSQGNLRIGRARQGRVRPRLLVPQQRAERPRLALRYSGGLRPRKTPTTRNSSATLPRPNSTSSAISSGASIGIIRAVSQPTCWSTKPTPFT